MAAASDPLQRVGPLASIPEVLAEFGIRSDKVLSDLPVDAPTLRNPESRIPYAVAGEILVRCAKVTGCPHFGLLVGAWHDHLSLGSAGRAMADRSTLGEAIAEFCSRQALNSQGAVTYLRRSDESGVFGYAVYDPRAAARDQIAPLIAALMCNIVRALTRGAASPIEVLLAHRRPADLRPYNETFRTPVRFDQAETAVVLTRRSLDVPVLPPSESTFPDASPDTVDGPHPASWAERVKRLIVQLLLEGEFTSDAIADRLGVHVRTLARRLEAEGTDYRSLLDEVRFTMARHLLSVTELRTGEIAHALGYQTHSSFSAAFRRWSGKTAAAWRSNAE